MKINKLVAGLLLGTSLLAPLLTSASDLESSNYSETAASNTAAVPNGFPDNIAPSSVKSIVREIMGAVKRSWNRSHPTITSGGAGNVQTLTYSTAPAAYTQGQTYAFVAGFSNSGATTLNVNALGAKSITKRGTTALAGGEIVAGEVVIVQYDGTQFQILSPGAAGVGTNTVANSNLAQMAANTVKGNNTGSTANAADLTVAQTVTMLGVVKSVKRQTFTSNGTYTPCAGLLFSFAREVGGGGGGGGVVSPGGSNGTGAGGGAAGSYAEGLFTAATIGVSQAVTIGAAGTAGANTGGTGGTGGQTSLGALLTAPGGLGGAGDSSGHGSNFTAAGGASGAAGTGDISAGGQPGAFSIVFPSFTSISGYGGSGPFGGGGGSKQTAGGSGSAAGGAGTGHGSGGSGASATGTGAAAIGGVGTAGMVDIIEYCSQ